MNVHALKNCLLVDLMSVFSSKMPFVFLLLLVFYSYMQIGAALFIIPYIFAFFPFVNEEKGVTALYFSPVGKKDVVLARYVYCLLLLFLTLLIYTALVPAISAVSGHPLSKPDASQYLLTFALYSGLISILLPLYFKFGYSKCQFSVYLIAFAVIALGVLINKIPGAQQVLERLNTLDPLLLSGAAAAIGFVMLLVSLGVSISITLKKDL